MRCKKWARSASARLVLLCAPFAATCHILFELGLPGWKEKALILRKVMHAPKPSQEQWLASWSKVVQLHAQCSRNWLNSPQLAAETMQRFSGDIVEVRNAEAGIRRRAQSAVLPNFLWEIERACSHALGGDIVLELVGSAARGTGSLAGFSAADGDLDIQVARRPGSGRAHEPFMETDRERVAQNLEQQRPEEFPALRGGSSFHDNSKRINAFLDQTPAAKQAIIAIKGYFSSGRPKGLLLEAIAWRLGSMKMELKTMLRRVPDGCMPECVATSFTFFLAMFEELRNWKRSPHFGRELQQDLDMLSDRKRAEYTAGFEEIARITDAELGFQLLLCASDVRLDRVRHICHKLPAAAEEAVRYYFSDFLEQEP
ncbi:hypothetical protein AK812_SmicGene12173 [Symbiodinium microadriaticum]|uniref:Uncharacterized protein n=1 Tax=Symbiodinium microadriaticum TaxID=2951 RepID=A0A1Q9EB97_SYMMI|nr:hypothetical protein AK812_SmicGene12173 [Symbiodinium microadriaticum]CAE7940513.1 unnamed protein product [Symbiodinium sp. KB8]